MRLPFPLLLLALLCVRPAAAELPSAEAFGEGLAQFQRHYAGLLKSGALKLGNEPRLLHHGRPTEDAIVLVHGLSDSPFYMLAVARAFHRAGANVVLPLLPGHGLKAPGAAMRKPDLFEGWRAEVDMAVAVARLLGGRVSIGGLSTGGALSVDKALRSPAEITGGLFLFSAALELRHKGEIAGRFGTAAHMVAEFVDWNTLRKLGCDRFPGIGRNPYRYPLVPLVGADELADLIESVNRSYGAAGQPLTQPVFAVHSTHDDATRVDGVLRVLGHTSGNTALLLLSTPVVSHASVVLAEDVPLDQDAKVPPCVEGREIVADRNPLFPEMMRAAIGFFDGFVRTR
ncbi:serine aminopeptidase domain-containing protein [Rhodospirillaceae bacterium SYSU D60014]|uniref:alpha/beta hydrolase n=1 Tax=Virgifigura deserti TaxID=2268457 RepID=UPI0013C48E0C